MCSVACARMIMKSMYHLELAQEFNRRGTTPLQISALGTENCQIWRPGDNSRLDMQAHLLEASYPMHRTGCLPRRQWMSRNPPESGDCGRATRQSKGLEC